MSEPTNPVPIGRYETEQEITDVFVAGTYAYAAWELWDEASKRQLGGLQILDASDPANPVRVGGWETEGAVEGVAVVGNHAYCIGAGLHVLDVSQPARRLYHRRFCTGPGGVGAIPLPCRDGKLVGCAIRERATQR